MFTPPKAAPGVLGVLMLALFVGAAQVGNKAIWTAKNGWSTEPACEKNKGGRYCWVFTKGMDVLYPSHWGASLKRRLYGVWHQASRKHLHRYVNEATFRLNGGNVRTHTLDRPNTFTDKAFRHRLTYMELIA